MHTFKKDIKSKSNQSTWFPLIDLNPQTFVENIFFKPEDFKSKHNECMIQKCIYSFEIIVDYFQTKTQSY
jgi:hypothetical protein